MIALPPWTTTTVAQNQVLIIGTLDTVTAAANFDTFIFRQSDWHDRARLATEIASLCGYKASRRAWYESPRAEPAEELHACPSSPPARRAARRAFGAPRQRVPIRSRPGANALAA